MTTSMDTPDSTLNWSPAWSGSAGSQLVQELFQVHYGYHPSGVWSAPGRVNLIGEHTDYNGGLALPIALPHRTYMAASSRNDRLLRLISAQSDGQCREVNLDQIGPKGSADEVSGWPAYVAGVFWAIEQAGYGPLKGADIAIDSCVPFGAGLSSSAALEGAAAVAIDELENLGLAGTIAAPNASGRRELIAACVRAENEVAGAPTGGMDQSACLLGQAGFALELDCDSGATAQIPFDLTAAGLSLLVIDTCAPHQLVDGQYAERRQMCEAAAKYLQVKNLAQISDLDEGLAQLEDPLWRSRVRHVVTEISRTRQVVDLLKSGGLSGTSLAQIGALFNASHESLRWDYEVTCDQLDLAVQVACEHGAYGARMTGGGFGGSAIALLDTVNCEAVAQAVAGAFQQKNWKAPQFLVAVAGEPAGKLYESNLRKPL